MRICFVGRCLVLAVAPASSALAGSVFTNAGAFLSNLDQAAFADFSDVPDVLAPIGGLDFTSDNGFAINIDAFFGQLFNDAGVISTNASDDAVIIQFQSDNVSAVGGSFWGTDIAFDAVLADVNIWLSDDSHFQFTTSSPGDFFGYIADAPLEWMVIAAWSDSGDPVFPTLDNLYVGSASILDGDDDDDDNIQPVPLPAPALLAAVGLGIVSLGRRR